MTFKPAIADRMSHIHAFHVMDLLGRARQLEAQGRSIIHMEIGEPDFESPAPVVEAGIAALKAGHTHYTPATGLPALRQAISGHYRYRYDVDIDPARIIVTPGASGALQLAFGVLFNPGDHILMADPSYPCNRHFAYFFGATPTGIPVDEHSDYQLTVALLEQHWSDMATGVMLASPSNPTGTLMAGDTMNDIYQFVHHRQAHMIVDEIYHGLVYDDETNTALKVADDIFVINSFSKFFGMTGWRVGWLVAPQAYVRECDKLAQNIFLAASTPAQYAALASFSPASRAILESRRDEFKQRRDFLLPALRELGFGLPVTPQGAFYLYADCSRFTDNSYEFSQALLEQAGVAITPGIDFGKNRPERYVRFAYTNSIDKLKQGVDRLAGFINA